MYKQKCTSTTGRTYMALCETMDTPVSLGCWLRYEYGEHLALASMQLDPLWYTNAFDFHADYSCVTYLQKSVELETGVDLQRTALEAFAVAEEKCRLTNERILKMRRNGETPYIEEVFHLARRKISQILGSCSWPAVLAHCRWGPGGTFDVKRRDASAAKKNSSVLTVTAGALPLIKACIEGHPMWMEALQRAEVGGAYSCLPTCFNIVGGNKVITVPKNAKTDRTIASEPTANSFLQQGAGRYIRDRLKRHGVDLDNQEVNQTWAREAHLLDLATLDLKAASDTISRELVFELLPVDWCIFLDLLRSPAYSPEEGKWTKYHKFSSMGNAYTFELESLIFFALCSAVRDAEKHTGPVAAYGDDLIVPKEIVPQVTHILTFCGFEVNLSKSFWDGRFYESCGKHYFDGFDVTPAYQKEKLDAGMLDSLIRGANRLFRLAHRLGSEWSPHRAALEARGVLLRSAGSAAQTYVKPPSPGDDAFDYPPDHRLLRRIPSRPSGWGPEYHCNVIRRKTIQKTGFRLGYYANLLWQNGSEVSGLSPTDTDPGVPIASSKLALAWTRPFVRAFLRRRWRHMTRLSMDEASPTFGGVSQIVETEVLIRRKRWIVPAG